MTMMMTKKLTKRDQMSQLKLMHLLAAPQKAEHTLRLTPLGIHLLKAMQKPLHLIITTLILLLPLTNHKPNLIDLVETASSQIELRKTSTRQEVPFKLDMP